MKSKAKPISSSKAAGYPSPPDSSEERSSRKRTARAAVDKGSNQSASEDQEDENDEPLKKKSKATSGKARKSNGSSKKSAPATNAGLVGSKPKSKKKESNRMEVMTKVPSKKTLLTYKPFPSFKATLNDGSNADFKVDQAVFILPDPENMKDPEGIPRQDEHWIGLIKEIRANSTFNKEDQEWCADPDDVWVVVHWFYKVADVEESGAPASLRKVVAESQKYFGSKEIIRTEDESIVSVFSCCEPCPVYAFSDASRPDEAPVELIDHKLRAEEDKEPDQDGDEEDNPNSLHAAQRNFFYRLTFPKFALAKAKKGKRSSEAKQTIAGLPLHCVCDKPYCPALDIMHHCLDCSKWYHTTCLEKWTEEVPPLESSGGKIPPQLAKLAKFPIARGGWWGIGGNINVVAKARSIVASGDFDKWEDELALAGLEEWEEFVATMERTEWRTEDDTDAKVFNTGYICPECETRI